MEAKDSTMERDADTSIEFLSQLVCVAFFVFLFFGFFRGFCASIDRISVIVVCVGSASFSLCMALLERISFIACASHCY
jgi:hypothetical protein